jgi:hypothetical protein
MTDKVETIKKAPATKAEVKKPVAKKAPARKPAAKKAAPKKLAPKKAAPKKVAPRKSVYQQFEDSVFAVPFKLANKTFMASLGMISFVQKEVDKQYRAFDKQFTKYAREGEKVFDRWEDRVEDLRKDVEEKADVAYDRVRDTLNKAA